jgi:hypothetical protein
MLNENTTVFDEWADSRHAELELARIAVQERIERAQEEEARRIPVSSSRADFVRLDDVVAGTSGRQVTVGLITGGLEHYESQPGAYVSLLRAGPAAYGAHKIAHEIAALRQALDDAVHRALSPDAPQLLGWITDTIGEATSGDPRRNYFDAATQLEDERNHTVVEINKDLAQLKADAAEDGVMAKEASELTFLSFVRRYRPLRKPALALLDNGNIRAMWKNAGGEQVGLQFREEDSIQFVLFKLVHGRLLSDAGRQTFDGLVERLKTEGLLKLVTG